MDNNPNAEPTVSAPVAQSPAPQPEKKLPVKLIAIIAGAVALVAIIAVTLYMTVFAGPSKADFRKAQTATNGIVSEYNDVSSELRSLVRSSSDTSDISELKTAYAKYKDNVAAIEKEHGIVLRDGETKKSYDAFKKKHDNLVTYFDGIIGSAADLAEANKNCAASKASELFRATEDLKTVADKYDAALGSCTASLDKVANSKNESLKAYATATRALYKEQRELFVKLQQAAVAGNTSEQRSVLRQISTQSREFRTSDSVKKFSDSAEQADVKDELNAFNRLLRDKAS